jgi:hypothetical protein|tara:strand:+ start:696 stop:1685 length:990 start_codon:yes stop_codon:yes gene_type:complete
MGSKKGFLEIQFNWIFILIAGAIIIMLFAGIITDQQNIFKVSADVSIITGLDAILSGYETSSGTVNIVEIPKVKIEFGCNSYSIGQISEQHNEMNVFAPSVLEGASIISMTREWDVPYKAANLVYLTNPGIRYVFIGNSDFARRIFEKIPDEVRNDGYTNVDAIENENDDKIRIIFFDRNPEFPENLNDLDNKLITALKVSGDEDKGMLEFFSAEDNKFVSKGTSHYIKESTLLGAVFSDDFGNYECAMKNLFKKLGVVSGVYWRKVNNLMLMYKHKQCEQYYDPGSIQAIKEASNSFTDLNINIIDLHSKNLGLQIKQLQRVSCPPIY